MGERVPVFVATRSRNWQVRGGEELSDTSPRRPSVKAFGPLASCFGSTQQRFVHRDDCSRSRRSRIQDRTSVEGGRCLDSASFWIWSSSWSLRRTEYTLERFGRVPRAPSGYASSLVFSDSCRNFPRALGQSSSPCSIPSL